MFKNIVFIGIVIVMDFEFLLFNQNRPNAVWLMLLGKQKKTLLIFFKQSDLGFLQMYSSITFLTHSMVYDLCGVQKCSVYVYLFTVRKLRNLIFMWKLCKNCKLYIIIYWKCKLNFFSIFLLVSYPSQYGSTFDTTDQSIQCTIYVCLWSFWSETSVRQLWKH